MTGTELPSRPDSLENVFIDPTTLVKAYEYNEVVELSRGDWERVKLFLKSKSLPTVGREIHYKNLSELELVEFAEGT